MRYYLWSSENVESGEDPTVASIETDLSPQELREAFESCTLQDEDGNDV